MQNKEYLSIAPCPIEAMPADAVRLLTHPEMFSTNSQQLGDTPPVAFLDSYENCQGNRKALKATAQKLFTGNGKYFSRTSVLVGVPGLNQLYLPDGLSGLGNLASRAAASADIAGDLGKKPIMLVLSYGPRPSTDSEWHEDAGKTYLICSQAISTVLALSNAEKIGKKINITPETALFSPLSGMPVSFKSILHTKPYELDSDDNEIEYPKSAMAVFYELSSAKQLCYYEAGAEPLKQRIKQLTGSRPKNWAFE